jgi:hypothetical protein
MVPPFLPPVIDIKGTAGLNQGVQVGKINAFKVRFTILIEYFLILFEGAYLIGSRVDYLVSYFIRATHGVYGHDTPLESYHLQQGRYRRDFSTSFFGFHLGKYQPIFGSPSAHQVDSFALLSAIEASFSLSCFIARTQAIKQRSISRCQVGCGIVSGIMSASNLTFFTVSLPLF